jgi:superfamily I DNA and/or RNA helicase
MNLRKLYESAAKRWLLLIKPILMTHPMKIATYFPPEPGIFDLGIIDEASQMPLKNAIGTLQRIKRVLIAGDENQMDPSYFFSSNDDNHSVFHQAKYHLKNIELTHHYRSESEELISFSNRHFYDNKLRFIENSETRIKQVIFNHYIEKGGYNNGINEIEAQEVVNHLVKQIENRVNENSIGIVAFSETQLKTILEKIPMGFLKIIEDLEESNQLFFKTLDQVQGDECDLLIISFGYGRNKEGDFEMRFGPINQTGGEKRLNVLFSRAKKEIHFFSSVKFSDFPQTKNESVILLKQWFALMEENNLKKSKSYEIHVLDILEQANDADDFTQLISIYNERGWKILPF